MINVPKVIMQIINSVRLVTLLAICVSHQQIHALVVILILNYHFCKIIYAYQIVGMGTLMIHKMYAKTVRFPVFSVNSRLSVSLVSFLNKVFMKAFV